jgi:hypothetical protein
MRGRSLAVELKPEQRRLRKMTPRLPRLAKAEAKSLGSKVLQVKQCYRSFGLPSASTNCGLLTAAAFMTAQLPDFQTAIKYH